MIESDIMSRKSKYIYIILLITILALSTVGSTYAYFTSRAESGASEISTKSSSYSINLTITPLYHDFSLIPMDDDDALKALKNNCHDKYGRGACSAYKVKVDGYDDSLGYISGTINTNLEGIENLSYMFLEQTDTTNDNNCINIDNNNYCVSQSSTPIITEENKTLVPKYNIVNTTEKNFILLVWLSNKNYSQNDTDIGNFDSTITFSMGDGGEIKGSISSAVNINNDVKSEE